MTQVIEITISPTGQSVVETRGFAGASCQDASRFIEEALGRQTAERLTTEFHQGVVTQERQQQRN